MNSPTALFHGGFKFETTGYKMKKYFLTSVFGLILTNVCYATDVGLAWYDNGSTISGPSSCTVGGTFVPPTPAPRPGYVFAGWKVKTINAGTQYTQLEYIESTNGQYIDTGVTLNGDSKIETKFRVPTCLGDFPVFGADNGSSYVDGEIQLDCNCSAIKPVIPSSNAQSYILEYIPYSVNTDYTISMDKNTLVMNNITYNTNWYASYQGTRSVYIFGTNRGSNSFFGGNTRVYYFKIYNNGTLVRDMVPARRNSDSALGMYDKVSGNFFTNARAADQYTRVEYLQSSGGQYIDTYIYPDNYTRVKTKIQFNSVTNNEFFGFGSGEAYNSSAFEFYTWDQKMEFNYGSEYKQSGTVKVNDSVEIDWNKNAVNYKINNGNTVTLNFSSQTFAAPRNMSLFSITRPSGTMKGKLKMYYFQMYDNNSLVRDMIPARRNSDSVLGMYDNVSSVFYTNVGSGTFTAGSNVSTFTISQTPFVAGPDVGPL